MNNSQFEKLKQEIENGVLMAFIKSAMPKGKDKDMVVRLLEAFNRRGVSTLTVIAAFSEVINGGTAEYDAIFDQAVEGLWD